MKFQELPINFNCVAGAFSIALDINYENLIKEIGKDGQKIIFPDLPKPYCFEGLDPREFVYWGIKNGVDIIQIERYLKRENVNKEIHVLDESESFFEILKNNVGVLTGRSLHGRYHAVAWNSEVILDPKGYTYMLHDFYPEIFYLIKK